MVITLSGYKILGILKHIFYNKIYNKIIYHHLQCIELNVVQ